MRKIINGSVLVDGQLVKKDILFDENEIVEISDHIEGDYDTVDATGLTVLPGLVDVHVHLREPGHAEKETIKTGTRAAAAGGFTTIFAMPNVIPFPSNVENMKAYLELIDRDACVHVHPYGTITKNEAGKEVVDFKALKEMGIRWFSDDGVGVADEEVMRKAMMAAKEAGVMFACHTEDMSYRRPGACVHDSEVVTSKGWLGIPSACESAQLIRDIHLVEEIHNSYHTCHVSAKESVEAIRQAKEKGLDVTGEVTAHHLLLEDKDVVDQNTKMNPPLRTHEDRMSLIEGLENGSLDFIANDHAPHTAEDKMKPMETCPFGIVSLETSFPLLYTEFVYKQKRWTLAQLIEWMSTKPAKRFGLDKIGKIEVGYHPDFTLVDLDNEYTIDVDSFESMGKNTPFGGQKVHAKVMETIVDSKTVWKGNK